MLRIRQWASTVAIAWVAACSSSEGPPTPPTATGGAGVGGDGVAGSGGRGGEAAGGGGWGSAVEPFMVRDYEPYDTSEAYREDSSWTEALNADRQFIDFEDPYPGYTRSIRYDFSYTNCSELGGTAQAGTVCDADALSVGRGIPLDGFSQADGRYKRVWAEIALRYSENFSACNAYDAPCDHKTIFFQVPDGYYRWEWHLTGSSGEGGPGPPSGCGTISAGPPLCSSFDPADDGDGQPYTGSWGLSYTEEYPRPYECARDWSLLDAEWHVVRIYGGNSTDSSTHDGRVALWIDGALVYDSDELVAHHGYPAFATWGPDGPAGDSIIRALLLGRNKDKGGGWYDSTGTARPDTWTESMWIGYSKIWIVDPGWALWPEQVPGKTVDHNH